MTATDSIREIAIRPVVAPLAEPVTTSSGTVADAPLVLIDLLTEGGVRGRAYIFAYQSFLAGSLAALTKAVAGLVIGEALVPADINRRMRDRFTLLGGTRGLAGMAVSGIDMVVWDTLARLRGMALVELLGGSATPLPAYRSLGMVRAGQAGEIAATTAEAGWRGLKVKIGWPDPAEDLEIVRALRGALPDSIDLMVDFNQSLAVPEAIARGRMLDDEGVAWIEEPVRCDDLAGCARVAAAIATPVQIGENFAGTFEMKAALDGGAAGLVMPDVQQIGGVTGWLTAAGLAAAAGVPMSSHLFIEASAHLLPVTPTRHWLEHLDIAAAIRARPVELTDGCITAPGGGGIGLEWDEDAVARWTVA